MKGNTVDILILNAGRILTDAHNDCMYRFVQAVSNNRAHLLDCDTLIVDNTNANALQIAPYMLVARSFGYNPQIVEFPLITAEECAARSVHSVPVNTCQRMIDSLADMRSKPYPFGWQSVKVGNL